MSHLRCLSPSERWLQLLLCIERETEARSAAGWVLAPLHPLGRTRPAAPSQNQLGTCGIQFGGGLWDWFLMGCAGSAAAPSAAAAALAGCVVLKASWGRGDVRKRGHEHLSHVSSACRVARSLWWQQPASGQGLGKPLVKITLRGLLGEHQLWCHLQEGSGARQALPALLSGSISIACEKENASPAVPMCVW